MLTAGQSSAGVGRSVVPVEDLVDYRSSAGQDVSAIISPYLPRGDMIIFGDKDSGKTALTLCALLAWGYKFGHVVFCCPHVHPDKLKSPKTSSVAKYKILEDKPNVSLVGMETEDPDEALEVLEQAFELIEEQQEECTGQLLLVLDDMAAFLCYNPIKSLLVREWVNLKHKRTWGWSVEYIFFLNPQCIFLELTMYVLIVGSLHKLWQKVPEASTPGSQMRLSRTATTFFGIVT